MNKSHIYMFTEGKTYLAQDGSAWTFVKRNDRSVVWVNVDGKHNNGGKPSKGYISVAIIPSSDGGVQELVVLPKDTKLSLRGEEAVEADTQVEVTKPKTKVKKAEGKSKTVESEPVVEEEVKTPSVLAVDSDGVIQFDEDEEAA